MCSILMFYRLSKPSLQQMRTAGRLKNWKRQRRKSVYNFWGTDIDKIGECASAEASNSAAIAEGKKPIMTMGSGGAS